MRDFFKKIFKDYKTRINDGYGRKYYSAIEIKGI